MGKTRRIIRYLSFQEIVDINRQLILKTGGYIEGAGKIINPDSLKYLVDIVHSKIDDNELYPTISQKAAVYAYNIITRHVFIDGNKRTGIFCAFYFLRINGYFFSESITENEIVDIALDIANGNYGLDELTLWFQKRLGLNFSSAK